MANQSLPTSQIVLDADGLPVPGAQAFYYQSGTLTLTSVFSDQAGTIPTTNPVIADGNGVLPQTYVTVTAKVIVKDAAGATLYTLDPVPVIQSVGSGASQISFNPTVTVPSTDVQDAIELVDANWRAETTALDAAKQPLNGNLTVIGGLTRTRGDIIRGGASGWERFALGAAGRNLVSDGTDLVYSAAMAYTEVSGSRAANTDYTNTGNRPLAVVVRVTYDGANANTGLLVGGVAYSRFSIGNGFTNLVFTHSVIVPPGAVYQLSKTAPAITIDSWNEAAL